MNTENFRKAQHSYQKGKSVETALHEVVKATEKSLKNKEFTMAASMDIEGAFNKVHSGFKFRVDEHKYERKDYSMDRQYTL